MNDLSNSNVLIYDTTLRDGSQGEGVSFTVTAKMRVAEKLDQFGIDYIEGGWPGSNPRDMAFFEKASGLDLKHAKLASFGSTRRANVAVEEDAQIQLLLDASTPVLTIFGKSWLLHVAEVIRTTPEENLAMIEDSVRYLKEQGRRSSMTPNTSTTGTSTIQNTLSPPWKRRNEAVPTFSCFAKPTAGSSCRK